MRPAIACSAASASISLRGPASASGAASRIAAGTVCATSSARLETPMLASMLAISLALGPMWRPTKSSLCSRAASGGEGGVASMVSSGGSRGV
ncbi:MAG: hypothetical protein AW07_01237 [Candidatus Accumulibacter sp. SK-11]|nr:MAG: hypothetical protein AW07_01237 [Candidatus Accumulibacter sp. SK-11]